MRIYENDKDIKIPNWYMKLPVCMIHRIADIGLWIQSLVPKRKVDMRNARNIKFNIGDRK